MSSQTRRMPKILAGISMACALGGLSWIAAHSDSLLWDLKTYHAAGQAFLAGLDPYSVQDLSLVASEPVAFPFVYPPYTLWLFSLFALPTSSTSIIIFLLLKAVALGTLLFLWKRDFLHDFATPLFVLFSFFAFNASTYRDFETGNISVFEQLGLWFAFSLLLRHRLKGFALILLVIGSFKLTPLVFLFLPLLFDHPRRKTVVSASLGVFAILAAATFFLSPRLSGGFIRNLNTSPGTGIVNPSLFQFFRDGRVYVELHAGISTPTWSPDLLYLVIAVCIVLLAVRALRILRRSDSSEKELLTVLFLCVVYTLVLPRVKDYSYILLVVPSWYILYHSGQVRSPGLLALFMMFPFHPPIAGFGILSTVWKFYPLAIALFTFFLYLQHILRLSRGTGVPVFPPQSLI